jgi:hypothetical protein
MYDSVMNQGRMKERRIARSCVKNHRDLHSFAAEGFFILGMKFIPHDE